MPRCSAPGCRTHASNRLSNPPIGLHVFPTEPKLRKMWIKALNRANWSPGRSCRVCSRHFQPDDFIERTHFSTKIKRSAIPSIFFVDPKQDKKVSSSEVVSHKESSSEPSSTVVINLHLMGERKNEQSIQEDDNEQETSQSRSSITSSSKKTSITSSTRTSNGSDDVSQIRISEPISLGAEALSFEETDVIEIKSEPIDDDESGISLNGDVRSNVHVPEFLEDDNRNIKECIVCHRSAMNFELVTFCPDCPDEPVLCIASCFRTFHNY